MIQRMNQVTELLLMKDIVFS